jgi:hypothetical protein
MKYLLKIIFLIYISAMSIIAQEKVRQKEFQYVISPREIALPVIAVQPNCPLQFENVILLDGVEGGAISSYHLRNIGTKPIRRFVVATSLGSVFTWQMNSGELVMPGQLVPQVKNDRDKIVPLTDELREKLNLKGSMKSVVIFMVVSVEFTDGTKYTDEKTHKAMTEFINELDDALYEHKQQTAKKP